MCLTACWHIVLTSYPKENLHKREHFTMRVCTGYTEVGYSPPPTYYELLIKCIFQNKTLTNEWEEAEDKIQNRSTLLCVMLEPRLHWPRPFQKIMHFLVIKFVVFSCCIYTATNHKWLWLWVLYTQIHVAYRKVEKLCLLYPPIPSVSYANIRKGMAKIPWNSSISICNSMVGCSIWNL